MTEELIPVTKELIKKVNFLTKENDNLKGQVVASNLILNQTGKRVVEKIKKEPVVEKEKKEEI